MNSKTCNIVEIADIHFGNGRVSPVAEYEHLQTYLYPELKDADILVINGDTFDTLLNMNSDAGLDVAKFIDDIIGLALTHHFYIRVVRGTFSHDRHQNRFFTVKDRGVHQLNGRDLVKVIDKITIEYFNELDLSILYCPDDQPHNDLTQAVIDVIQSNHLKTVDLVCSHGYFMHLIPAGVPHIPHNTLDWERLKKYVSGLVFNGHVHHRGVHDHRVISSGSFERFDHSVVESVGFWKATVTNKKWTYEFVENKSAIPFKTFTESLYTSSQDVYESIVQYIEELYKTGYPKCEPIYIRIIGQDPSIGVAIRTAYPSVFITDKRTSAQPVFDNDTIRTDCDELPVITEDNLAQMVYDAIEKPCSMTLEEIKEIIDEL